MWVEVKKANNLMMAEMWQELFEGEGIPARIRPASGKVRDREAAVYAVLVPQDKQHLIGEVIRKL